MRNLKKWGSLFLFSISAFNIGLYVSSAFKYNDPVEPHKWVLTSLSGLLFLGFFLFDNNK